MSAIRFSERIWRMIHDHLFAGGGEHFAFAVARLVRSAEGPIFLATEAFCIPDHHVSFGEGGWSVDPAGLLPAVNAAVRSGGCLIEAHNHGGVLPRFSRTDRRGLQDFKPYIFESLPGRPYVATVWGDSSVYAEYYSPDGSAGSIRSITASGSSFRQLVSRDDDETPVLSVFDRQLPWFTESGQKSLGRLRVAIVGAGGTGSHVVQQLAYLGVRDFVLVDHDPTDTTSMNRVVTATAADIGKLKVGLAKRLIKATAPDAAVAEIPEKLQTPVAIDALKRVDVIFGCVDNDGARVILNELSRAYCIPYFDLASGITVQDGCVTEAGGRVIAVVPGGPCLQCCGEIDADEARFFLSKDQDRTYQVERGYVRGLDTPAASVVSLNGQVASLAVSELAIYISGVRPVTTYQEVDVLGTAYETKGQRVFPRRVMNSASCVVCSLQAAGDKSHIDRYASGALSKPVLAYP